MDYKDIVIDNDAIVNTAPEELPEEAHNIPQGVKPQLNPNPGYGEDDETKPAIKTEPVKGEIVKTPEYEVGGENPITPENRLINFLKGVLIKGKPLEEYIDSQGGVTEEELVAALVPYAKKTELASKANVWYGEFIGDETVWEESMKVGDILVEGSGFVGIIGLIRWIDGALDEVEVKGIENNAAEVTSYYFDGENWVTRKLSVGTKLYKHIYSNLGNDKNITFLSTRETPYDSEILLKNDWVYGSILNFTGFNANGEDKTVAGLYLSNPTPGNNIGFSDGVNSDSIAWADLTEKDVTEL